MKKMVKGMENDKRVYLSNGEFFYKNCYKTDLCRINRMWLKHLDSTIGRDCPKWEKELEYDKWLKEDFDANEWDAAAIKTETRESGYLLGENKLKTKASNGMLLERRLREVSN